MKDDYVNKTKARKNKTCLTKINQFMEPFLFSNPESSVDHVEGQVRLVL